MNQEIIINRIGVLKPSCRNLVESANPTPPESKIMLKRTLLLPLIVVSIALKAQNTVGLLQYDPGNQDGYVLFAPNFGDTTYLIDKCGNRVHQWASPYQPGQSVYLLEDGSLLRTGRSNSTVFNSGGQGGWIERYDWNNQLIWSYRISNATECAHHDVRFLPNGNILVIVWDLKTPSEALAIGRDSAKIGTSLWGDKILELQPVGNNGANIVWEWNSWDHLVQDYNPNLPNYGTVAQHPELINLNYINGAATNADWLHCNAIDYNPLLDQVIISSHNLCEFWIIDHSTTMAEAAAHTGGRYGKGGDILYRWGNPQVYNRGTTTNKKLYGQHNTQWIQPGLTDAGNILVFNNGLARPGGNYSTVDIIAPPIDSAGNYTLNGGSAFGPDSAYWKYTAPVPSSFFSTNISGAQRLSSGNTLICSGSNGIFFEIDVQKNSVWRYVSPVGQNGALISQGNNPTMNSVFRSTLYEASYPGLAGQSLVPGTPIELNPTPSTCAMITSAGTLTESKDIALSVTNPFSDVLWLHYEGQPQMAAATLYDMTGKVVQTWDELYLQPGESTALEVQHSVSTGCYMLHVNVAGTVWRQRMVAGVR